MIILIDKKKELAVSHPRENLSTHLIDVSELKMKDDFSVKMEWTDTHKIRPLGLAKRLSGSEMEIKKLNPKSIKHSHKDLENPVRESSLSPGETLTIDFPATKKGRDKGKERSFVLRSKGNYKQI